MTTAIEPRQHRMFFHYGAPSLLILDRHRKYKRSPVRAKKKTKKPLDHSRDDSRRIELLRSTRFGLGLQVHTDPSSAPAPIHASVLLLSPDLRIIKFDLKRTSRLKLLPYPVGISGCSSCQVPFPSWLRPAMINTVVRDCFHREIITNRNNAYGVLFSIRSVCLSVFPSLVLGYKRDKPAACLNAAASSFASIHRMYSAICFLTFRTVAGGSCDLGAR